MSLHAMEVLTTVSFVLLIGWLAACGQVRRWQVADFIAEMARTDTPRRFIPWGTARVDEDTHLQDTTTTIRKLTALADPCPVCYGDHPGNCEDQPIEGVIVDASVADDDQWRWDDQTGMWLPPRALAEAEWYNTRELVSA